MTLTTDRWPTDASLRPDYPALPLFGWLLLAIVGQMLIVPAPWTLTWFYRFLCRNVSLPNGRRLRFTGWPGDIWYAPIGIGLLPLLPAAAHLSLGMKGYDDPATLILLELAIMVVNWGLALVIVHWFVANVQSEDRRMSPEFVGSLMAFIGWQLLLILSFFTVIGWAWVASAFTRWLCRNVRGNAVFDFTGSGLSILWRTLVFLLLCQFILPIPWMLRWLANWYASRITVVPLS
jgi:hypothetical protein